ncbi:hypothetical protein Sjap_010887 [Stephania japonica]|uniref:Cytochrome P450 n=1 Tax=Stephania japonica TaxID=461633 RepID=A0AAP0JBA6_9MAGN
MERYYFPFGSGRRACRGMELVKVEVADAVANLGMEVAKEGIILEGCFGHFSTKTAFFPFKCESE